MKCASIASPEETRHTVMRPGHLALAFIFVANAIAASPDTADEAGVRAAEDRWSEAFITGDAATLETLLDADYVSTGANGNVRPKNEIIRIARAYAKEHPGGHAKPLASTSTIRVIGEAAVVRHRGESDTSVDVFYFRDGHWHAWYSQHTKLEP
jgi:hypothetical protein